MATELRLNVLGEERIIRFLDGIEDRLNDLRPAWEKIVDDMIEMEEGVFASEGASIGESWPPLSSRYAAWKSVHWPGRSMLVASGKLKASLTDKGSPDMVIISEPQRLEFGSAAKVGQWFLATLHQEGIRSNEGRKVRRLLPEPGNLPADHLNKWVRIIGDYVTGT